MTPKLTDDEACAANPDLGAALKDAIEHRQPFITAWRPYGDSELPLRQIEDCGCGCGPVD